MNKRFSNQVSIITGGATGIGYSVAKRLGEEGSKLVIVDQDADLGKQTVAEFNASDMNAVLVIGDVSDEKVAENAVAQAKENWDRLDVLINNAGITGDPGSIWELPVSEMDRVYRTNLRATYLFCQKAIPLMLKNDYGRIVNIASISGKEGNPKMVPYSSTKAAVIGLTKSVGKELSDTGIRVNCVTPVVARTAMLDQTSPEVVDYMLSKIPLGRPVELSEIASLVTWVASEECSFTTAGVFDISGGRATY
ncbi:MAG: SDR family NAD(P)-dependent oxidoreductase [Chloroflexota bacterium]|jgi:3-oxoacyl-[acyl-carrier protein] reductase|tara:strand:- start:816 stop:1568 length:753 start_codon:yes stop_codon:yes gene_type:complete